MTELRMERPVAAWDSESAAPRSAGAARWVNLAAALLVAAWSFVWLPPMFEMVRAQTAIGQEGLAAAASAHAIFELTFVAAHCGVRWLPGVAAILGAAWLTRWWLRRG